jgi:hypothetical protein
MIEIVGAKRQQHKEMEQTWTKEETVLQKATRNIQELALEERRTLP